MSARDSRAGDLRRCSASAPCGREAFFLQILPEQVRDLQGERWRPSGLCCAQELPQSGVLQRDGLEL
jgi:hypothetical protein